MSSKAEKAYDWATDCEPFYVFLGIYVAGFQWIETKLDEILLLHAGPEHHAETLKRLAPMKNYQKIEAVSAAALDKDRFPRIVDHSEWKGRVTRVIEGLGAERVRRNAILHSTYWLRGLEQGLSAIRANKKRVDGALKLETEEMNRERMDAILKDVASLAFDTGQLHIQLVHWAP